MRSITYADVERGVAATAGIDPLNLLSHEKVLLSEYITDATKFCWDYYPWAEFTKTEKRYFRDEYRGGSPIEAYDYVAGDEVYYLGKYYRCLANHRAIYNPPALDEPSYDSYFERKQINWYEIGDTDGAPDWKPDGVYKIGAKVRYEGKLYLCIEEPKSLYWNQRHSELIQQQVIGIEDYQDEIDAIELGFQTGEYREPVCYEINGYRPPLDTYFLEIDEHFDRYIAYEQEGKDSIGTCLAVTLDDPRYNNTTPLNWREDREGIYIDPADKIFQHVWLRYRLEAPIFDTTSAAESIPQFLAQAIKAFAYKSWLIGDGQHEKATTQDIYGMDLLVRELDKLDSQQDRAQPFTVTKNPYRRINSKQGLVTPEKEDEIGHLYKVGADVSMKLSTNVSGRNAVVKAYVDGDPIVDVIVEGYNAVRKAYPESNVIVSVSTQGLNAVKQRRADAYFTAFTGVPHRGIAIGDIKGYSVNLVQESVQDIYFFISATNVGRNIIKKGTLVSSIVTSGENEGENIVKKGIIDASLTVSSIANGINLVKKANVDSSFIVGTASASGYNAVRKGTLNPSVDIASSIYGKNIVKHSDLTINAFQFVVTVSTQAYNAVELGSVSSEVSIDTNTSAYNAVELGSVSAEISIDTNTSAQRVRQGSVTSAFAVTSNDIEALIHDPVYVNTTVDSLDYFNPSYNLDYSTNNYAYKTSNGRFHQYFHPTDNYFPISFIGFQFDLPSSADCEILPSYATSNGQCRMRFILRSDGANSTTALSGSVTVFKKTPTSSAFEEIFTYTMGHYSAWHSTYERSPVGAQFLVNDNGSVTTSPYNSYTSLVDDDGIRGSENNMTSYQWFGQPYFSDPNNENENLIFHHLANRGNTYRYIFDVNIPVKIYSGCIGSSSDDTNHRPEIRKATSGLLAQES